MDNPHLAAAAKFHRARRSASSLLLSWLVLSLALVHAVTAPPEAAADPFGPGSAEGTVTNDRVRPNLFGMTLGGESWPDLALGSVRIPYPWSYIERTPNTYDWTVLDEAVSGAQARGAIPLLVIGSTPEFHGLGVSPTQASPPRPNAYKRFARALVSRYGDRADYQVWNEPNVGMFYTGTPTQMAWMTKLLGEAVDDLAPTATAVAPSFPLRGPDSGSRRWFREYWKQTLGKNKRPVAEFVDAASIAAYPMPHGDPEDGLAITQWARNLVANRGFEGPLWAAEINYGGSGELPTTAPLRMKKQVAFVVRTYVLHATVGAERVYWWQWEGHQTVNTHLNDGEGGLTPAGTAFGVVQDWLVNTRPLGCTVSRGVTRCGFRARNGVERYVYWTRSGRASSIRAPKGTRTKTDPAGATVRLKPGTRVRVGLTPTMIQVRSD